MSHPAIRGTRVLMGGRNRTEHTYEWVLGRFVERESSRKRTYWGEKCASRDLAWKNNSGSRACSPRDISRADRLRKVPEVSTAIARYSNRLLAQPVIPTLVPTLVLTSFNVGGQHPAVLNLSLLEVKQLGSAYLCVSTYANSNAFK